MYPKWTAVLIPAMHHIIGTPFTFFEIRMVQSEILHMIPFGYYIQYICESDAFCMFLADILITKALQKITKSIHVQTFHQHFH